MAAWTYFEGTWHEGNPKLMGPLTQAAWLCCTVFDGARAFEGQAPDLDLHCQRVVRSARSLGMKPTRTPPEIEALAREGIARFADTAELYIRPMFWAEDGPLGPDPATTRFALYLEEAKLTAGSNGALDPADYERTVKTLMSAGSEPVITKEPTGAWTHAVSDKALN